MRGAEAQPGGGAPRPCGVLLLCCYEIGVESYSEVRIAHKFPHWAVGPECKGLEDGPW